VGSRAQFVVLHGHEQHCLACGRTLREPIDFAQGKRRRTKAFDRYVLELCQIAPIKQVAGLVGVGWDLVKDLFKGHLAGRLAKRKLGKVRYLAVDEFALRKGHHYMTVVLDLQRGRILHAQEGRDAEALIPFLKKLKRHRVKLQAVAMDMSPAYLRAVREVFPHVAIVHDPYHVVALANRAIDETRRDMARSLEGEERKVIKGSRFLLLKGLEKLRQPGLAKLVKLMEANEPLFLAYLLKEGLRELWQKANREAAERFLDSWLDQARSIGNKHFAKLADTLDGHRKGLLAYYDHPITSGPLEGLNNKIKVLKRQAYGFRDNEYFKLRLYFLHEATPAIAG
jgi:transposase